MSRIGNKAISVPQSVRVSIEGNSVSVKGPKGELSGSFHQDMALKLEDGVLTVARPSDDSNHRALHGLTRSLIANMVQGVSEGYKKDLELVGIGYRVQQAGEKIVLQVGYSHPVEIAPPPGISLAVGSPTRLTVEGIDKQLVGEVAANIRSVRPPEPYKGKGIRYSGEVVRRKAGKGGKIGSKKGR